MRGLGAEVGELMFNRGRASVLQDAESPRDGRWRHNSANVRSAAELDT